MRIASWNVEGKLSQFVKKGRGTPGRIVDEIERLNADVIFLPEASSEDVPIHSDVEQRLKGMGYVSYAAPDDRTETDIPPGVIHPTLRFLSRLPVSDFRIVKLAGLRNALVVKIHDSSTEHNYQLIGVHLNDDSEKLRLEQLNDLVPLISNSRLATIVMGDFNAMHGASIKARIMRSHILKSLARILPGARFRYFLKRGLDMATGTTMASLLSETGLHDIDPRHHPTTTPKRNGYGKLPSIRLVDLDHVLVSDQVTVLDFTISRYDRGSDHRSISATITT